VKEFGMGLSNLTNESLLRFYESVRDAVNADRHALDAGSPHYFASGDSIRNYAASLQDELRRRAVTFSPIEWWYDQ
jgi:hypothetical protein